MNSIFDECKVDIIKYIKAALNINYDPENKLFWKYLECQLNMSIPVINSSESIHWTKLKKYFQDTLIPCLHHPIFQLSEEECQLIRYPYLLYYFNIHLEVYFGSKTTNYLSNKMIDIHKAIINYTLNKKFNPEIWLTMSEINPERKYKLFKININDKQHFNLNMNDLRKLQKFIGQKDLPTTHAKPNNEWLQKDDVQVNVISSQSDLTMPRIIQQNKKCKSINSSNVQSQFVSSSVDSIRKVIINHDKTIPCLKCKTKLALGENVLLAEDLYSEYKEFIQANDPKLEFDVLKEIEKVFPSLQDLKVEMSIIKHLENVNKKKNRLNCDTNMSSPRTFTSKMIDDGVNVSQNSLNYESLIVCHPEPSQPNPRLFNTQIDEDMSE